MKLRTPQIKDLNLLLEWENNPKVQLFSSEPKTYTKEDIEQFIQRNENLVDDGQQRLMVDKGENTIGCLDFYDFDPENRSAYVGILIYTGQREGYGKRALELMADYARRVYHLRELRATVPVENCPAIGLFLKAGYKNIGDTTFAIKL